LERFPAKWVPVRAKKTRQNKSLVPGSDSIRTGNALADLILLAGSGKKPAHAGHATITHLGVIGVAELLIGQSGSADCCLVDTMMSDGLLRCSSDLDRRRRHQRREQKRNKGLAHFHLSMILPVLSIVTIKYEVNYRKRETPKNRSQLPKS
jgi:hypothetical protein